MKLNTIIALINLTVFSVIIMFGAAYFINNVWFKLRFRKGKRKNDDMWADEKSKNDNTWDYLEKPKNESPLTLSELMEQDESREVNWPTTTSWEKGPYYPDGGIVYRNKDEPALRLSDLMDDRYKDKIIRWSTFENRWIYGEDVIKNPQYLNSERKRKDEN